MLIHSDKPTILFIKTFSNGGLNNVIELLIQQLKKTGQWRIKIVVVDYRIFGIDLPLTQEPYSLIHLQNYQILSQKIQQFLYFLNKDFHKLETLIEELKPNLVIWSHDSLLHIPPIPRSEIKQVFFFQEWLREKYEQKVFKQSSLRRRMWSRCRSLIIDRNKKYLKNVNLVVFHSKLVQNLSSKIYPITHKIIIQIGINTKKYKIKKNTPSSNSNDNIKNILFIGPLADFKGIGLLVNALILLSKQYKIRFRNIYYKQGRDFQRIKRMLKQYQDIKFTFIQNPSEERKISYINDTDILIHVPRFEPFGLSIIEALSCGTKVIAYKNIGVLEYLQNQKGLYILHHYSIESLADLIINTLKVKADRRTIRNDFLTKNLNVEKTINKLVQVFDTL